MIDLCRFLVKAAQNERKSSNFATEKRLNRDGKAPTKNENGWLVCYSLFVLCHHITVYAAKIQLLSQTTKGIC